MEVTGKVERIGKPQHKFGENYTVGIKIEGKWYNSPLLTKEKAGAYFSGIEEGNHIRLEVGKNEKGFEEIIHVSKNGQSSEEANKRELEIAEGIISQAKKEEVELLRECIQMAIDAWKNLEERLPVEVFWREVGATARTLYIENKRRARW
jgi:hypothetical protein